MHFSSVDHHHAKVPNEISSPIHGTGQAALAPNVLVDNVLYISEFTCDLLYVSKAHYRFESCCHNFTTFCVLQDRATNWLIIGTVEMHNVLYYFKPLKWNLIMVKLLFSFFRNRNIPLCIYQSMTLRKLYENNNINKMFIIIQQCFP